MKQISEKICFWHGASRRENRAIAYEKQGCYVCNGRNEGCSKYLQVINTYLMQQNTHPYEESHAGFKKSKNIPKY